jgi:hypothetical protein
VTQKDEDVAVGIFDRLSGGGSNGPLVIYEQPEHSDDNIAVSGSWSCDDALGKLTDRCGFGLAEIANS